MSLNIEGIIFYLLVLDAIIVNIIAWFFITWFRRKHGGINKIFPVSRGWAVLYLILTLWIGYGLYRLGNLGF